MASESITERLLQAIETQLGNIVAGSVYHNTVRYVRRVNGAAPAINRFASLEIQIASTDFVREIGFGGEDLYEASMKWRVWAYDSDSTNPQLAASRLEQDVRSAIEQDVSLGDIAKDTQWRSTNVWLFEHQAGLVAAEISFETTYLVQRSDTSLSQ